MMIVSHNWWGFYQLIDRDEKGLEWKRKWVRVEEKSGKSGREKGVFWGKKISSTISVYGRPAVEDKLDVQCGSIL